MPNGPRSLAELLVVQASLLKEVHRQREEARLLREEHRRLALALFEQHCLAQENMAVSLHRLAMHRLRAERQ